MKLCTTLSAMCCTETSGWKRGARKEREIIGCLIDTKVMKQGSQMLEDFGKEDNIPHILNPIYGSMEPEVEVSEKPQVHRIKIKVDKRCQMVL